MVVSFFLELLFKPFKMHLPWGWSFCGFHNLFFTGSKSYNIVISSCWASYFTKEFLEMPVNGEKYFWNQGHL